eukprot:1344241-Amorphochlora_amoeboformis.AAC.1
MPPTLSWRKPLPARMLAFIVNPHWQRRRLPGSSRGVLRAIGQRRGGVRGEILRCLTDIARRRGGAQGV